MEQPQWIIYAVIGFSALLGLWKAFGRVAFFTSSTKDDEFFEKVDPFVEKATDLVESATGQDLDGDGSVGKE